MIGGPGYRPYASSVAAWPGLDQRHAAGRGRWRGDQLTSLLQPGAQRLTLDHPIVRQVPESRCRQRPEPRAPADQPCPPVERRAADRPGVAGCRPARLAQQAMFGRGIAALDEKGSQPSASACMALSRQPTRSRYSWSMPGLFGGPGAGRDMAVAQRHGHSCHEVRASARAGRGWQPPGRRRVTAPGLSCR